MTSFVKDYKLLNPRIDLDEVGVLSDQKKSEIINALVSKLVALQDNEWAAPFHYAFAIHDSDFDEDGCLKKPHIHLVVSFTDPIPADLWTSEMSRFATAFCHLEKVAFEKVMRKRPFTCYKLVMSRGDFCEPLVYLNSSLKYLIHKGWPNKTQYPFESIIADYDVSTSEAFVEEGQYQVFNEIIRFIRSGCVSDYSDLIQWVSEHRWLKVFKKYSNEIYRVFTNEMYKMNRVKMSIRTGMFDIPGLNDPISLATLYGKENNLYFEAIANDDEPISAERLTLLQPQDYYISEDLKHVRNI